MSPSILTFQKQLPKRKKENLVRMQSRALRASASLNKMLTHNSTYLSLGSNQKKAFSEPLVCVSRGYTQTSS